ncbi:MAG: DUF4363 family protein [Oscillospiraceae bacterium]
MKRFFVAVFILAAVFSITLWNSGHLQSYTGELSNLLVRAKLSAAEEDWPLAKALTGQALDKWQCKANYLHITLRHNDTNAIYEAFREAASMAEHRDSSGYAAANAKLLAHLELLYGMEQLNFKNVL